MPDDRDSFDDFGDRPRRRRPDAELDDEPRWGDERDDYDDEPSRRASPEDRVRGPGTSLIVVGWVGVAATILALAMALAIGLSDPPPQHELIVNIVIGAFLGVISLGYFGVIAAGGHQMVRCRRYGLAMAAAVMAIASVALIGLCSFVILPFGIWAVVVLGQADVRKAFERPRTAYD